MRSFGETDDDGIFTRLSDWLVPSDAGGADEGVISGQCTDPITGAIRPCGEVRAEQEGKPQGTYQPYNPVPDTFELFPTETPPPPAPESKTPWLLYGLVGTAIAAAGYFYFVRD